MPTTQARDLEIQKHAVIVLSEGLVDTEGRPFGAVHASKDPAGNLLRVGSPLPVPAGGA